MIGQQINEQVMLSARFLKTWCHISHKSTLHLMMTDDDNDDNELMMMTTMMMMTMTKQKCKTMLH